MSEDTVCRHNQKGFCKFKQNCRNLHENRACPEEDNCSNKKCQYRHPKVCRNYSGEETCPFGLSCAYKHPKEMNMGSYIKNMIEKHSAEVKTIQEEVNKLKVIILEMENKIMFLNEEMLAKQQTDIGEIVTCVLTILNSSQRSKSYPVTFSSLEKDSGKVLQETHEDDISFNCDFCNFECVKEESFMAHMSEEHEECPPCYLCGKYFETKKLLKVHHSETHKEMQYMTESEHEEDAHETKDKKKVKKKNKTKKK